jgi:small subunit ribosomal protein S4
VVRHGHVEVNGRKVNIPSFQVSVGDTIAIREGAKKLVVVESARDYAQQNRTPSWLQPDFENLSGKVLSLPKRDEVQLPVNEQLIVELYSK